MITKEFRDEKICLLCANDYHLEMILLPYIKERLDKSKFIIFTENNLEKTIETVLTKVSLKEETKKQILDIGWTEEKNGEKEKKLKELIYMILNDKNKKDINIIINGEYQYIKDVNNKIKEIKNSSISNAYDLNKIKILDCFHVDDTNIDIEEIKTKYKYFLNTQKI